MLLAITTDEEISDNIFIKKYLNSNTDTSFQFNKVFMEDYTNPVYNKIIVARNLFDLREFKKCSDLLKPYASDTNNQTAMFLYHYSLFMHGDLRKEEEFFENSKQTDIDNHRSRDKNYSVNNAAHNLENILEPFYKEGLLGDLCCYLLGIAKRELEKFKEAVEIFAVTLDRNPCFWSAWLELCKIVSSHDYIDAFESIQPIKNHWMKNFYLACL